MNCYSFIINCSCFIGCYHISAQLGNQAHVRNNKHMVSYCINCVCLNVSSLAMLGIILVCKLMIRSSAYYCGFVAYGILLYQLLEVPSFIINYNSENPQNI